MRYVAFFLVIFFIVGFLLSPPVEAAGGSVDLAWDANTEPDLDGYNIYYGTASGDYSHSVDVGDVTEYTLTGLEEGNTYYLAATAYDTDDNESDFSKELVHRVPFMLPGEGRGLSYKNVKRRFEW